MIERSARPLALSRLDSLLRGLRHRFEQGAQQTEAEVAQVEEQAAACAAQRVSSSKELKEVRSKQVATSTTEWDEGLCSRWDDAELRSFKAIFETADRESHARREAKETIERATTEAKKRIADVEQRFLRAKDVPLKHLADARARLNAWKEELRVLESETEVALATRSIRLGTANVSEVPNTTQSTTQEAFGQIRSALDEAARHARRLQEQPLGKFFESFWWWGVCGLIFAAVTGILIGTGWAQPLWAALAGIVTTVVVFLGAMIGIHPWVRRAIAAEVPVVRGWFQHASRLIEEAHKLAVEENDSELKRLAAKRDQRFEQAKTWRDQQVTEVTTKLDKLVAELHQKAEEQKQTASQWLTASLEEVNGRFGQRLTMEEQRFEQETLKQQEEYARQQNQFQVEIEQLNQRGAQRIQRGTQQAMRILDRSRRWCSEQYPEWASLLESPQAWPVPPVEPILPVGYVCLGEQLPESAGDGILSELSRPTASPADSAPVLFAPLHDHYMTITGDPAAPAVRDLVRNLIMRAITGLPAGKTQVCVIDPPGLGRDFGWLMHLGDFDPNLVHHRVWTQPPHIAKKIQELSLAAEDFIQQSLRNQYQNIVQYNRDAGALAEPYRILVWSSLPSGLDDQSWKGLRSLLDSGARCGIVPILVIDPAATWPTAGQLELLQRRGLHLTLSDDRQGFKVSRPNMQSMLVRVDVPADEIQAQAMVKEVGRRAMLSSRVEVPLSNLLPTAEERWQGDSSRCLEIPIGQSGVGRVHSLKLGIGTAQHAIIAGKTGSGKSSLLHALLTSALLKYSPDRLRLVLLDFKKGVEFQVYSESRIAHADIIGIESQREFGLSALEYIDACLQRRGELYRQAGVQDIASWNLLHPDSPMPRMLLVIDEFQELFVEDDKLSSQASLILDRIVRQGRSFGVHAILSSQTLAGSYSLPRTTLGQMAVRIALQCDPSDAQIIFADDNPAAARLKFPGQAVYNDAGGRIEGNQPMQIGWLSKSQQQQMFAELPVGYQNHDLSTNLLGKTIVFDGNRPARWSGQQVEQAISTARQNVNPEAVWCVVGESVAISPAVAVPFTQQSGRNLLLVGAEDAAAAAVLSSLVATFTRHVPERKLICVQGARPTDSRSLSLSGLWRSLPGENEIVDSRDAAQVVSKVHEMLQERMNAGDAATPPPVLLVLVQLGRMKELRREDDFSSFGSSEVTADKRLEELLRDGPAHGLFTVIWAENHTTVNRWLSRAALRELEMRIMMQMSANDSTNLIDSVAASRLGDHVLLLVDEATGQEQKFRPFAGESLAEMTSWAAGLDEN